MLTGSEISLSMSMSIGVLLVIRALIDLQGQKRYAINDSFVMFHCRMWHLKYSVFACKHFWSNEWRFIAAGMKSHVTC